MWAHLSVRVWWEVNCIARGPGLKGDYRHHVSCLITFTPAVSLRGCQVASPIVSHELSFVSTSLNAYTLFINLTTEVSMTIIFPLHPLLPPPYHICHPWSAGDIELILLMLITQSYKMISNQGLDTSQTFCQIEAQWHSYSWSRHENKLTTVDKRYSFLKWSGWRNVQWHVIDLYGRTCQLLYAFRSEHTKRQERTL